jgi:hypothetical protein
MSEVPLIVISTELLLKFYILSLIHFLCDILRKVCCAHNYLHIEHTDKNFEKNYTCIFPILLNLCIPTYF